MPEFLTNFSNQLTEYWNKFSRTQKIQIIAIFAAGLTALIVLTLVLSQPTYVVYRENVSATEMNTIKATLDEASIRSEISADASKISVESGKIRDATLALAEVGILSTRGFSWSDAFTSTSMTTTSDEKRIMHQLAMETDLGELISMISAVNTARVKVVLPEDFSSILQEDKEASASVMLELNTELSQEQIEGIASVLESTVENLSTERIKIFDANNSKLLYNGSTNDGMMGALNSYLEMELAMEAVYQRNIESLLLARSEYDDAVVHVNLTLDFDQETTLSELHTLPEGQTESLPTRVYEYQSSGASTDSSGIPGTDSNSDTTTYAIQGAGGTESETTISEKDYAVNIIQSEKVKSVGAVVPEKSTVTVTLNKFVDHKQSLLEEQGALEGTTWEQYKETNQQTISIDADPNITTLVANSANLNENDVFIMAYEVHRFIDKPVAEDRVADYIPVIIIVFMIALLGYAVYKGTEPVEITEVEPELSVEDMLASTKVTEELEAIEFDDKSEARVQIERFVDENPEAVAQLLRNWLNEDWE